jgi:outer membrane receptor for ferrienterochelin and colicins
MKARRSRTVQTFARALLRYAARSLWAIAVLCAVPLISTGQQSQTDLSEASLEQLGQIRVYSASGHLQLAMDAPSSVTIVNADEIQRYGYRTLADVLATVSGFYVFYDRNYSYVGVQGFARPGDYNSRILLLVDGHRLNDNVYDQAMLGTEFPIDIDLIQRIEIVRGPISSLYGSNALFAVVNVITRKGHDLDGLELSAAAGSFNSYKGRVSYGAKRDKLEFLLSGTFYGSRGHNALFFPEYDAPETNNGIASHADDDQLGSALATISYGDFTLQALYGTREKAIPTGAWSTIFDDPGTRTTDSHDYIDLRYAHGFNKWDVLARFQYDRYFYQGTYIYPPGEGGHNLDFADGKWWDSELQLSTTVWKRNHLTFGGEFRDNVRQSQTSYNMDPFQMLLADSRSSFVGAAFAQDELTINHALSLNLGYRYDCYSHLNGSGAPRAALIYKPRPQTALKLIYARSFREPNVYELYYNAAPNLPNPNLKPEKMQTLQAGWEQGLGNRGWFTVLVFHNEINQLITQEVVDQDSLKDLNLRSAHANGIELQIRGRLFHGFEGSASYNFQQAKDTQTGHLLDSSPTNLFKLNVSQSFLHDHIFASLDGQYMSAIQTSIGFRLPPSAVFNFTLLGRNINKHIDVSASIYNVFNTAYYNPPPQATILQSLQQDGRSARFTLSWHQSER